MDGYLEHKFALNEVEIHGLSLLQKRRAQMAPHQGAVNLGRYYLERSLVKANADSAADSQEMDRKRLLPLLLISGFLQHAVNEDFVAVSVVL